MMVCAPCNTYLSPIFIISGVFAILLRALPIEQTEELVFARTLDGVAGLFCSF
jgi:hypothetical protein